MNNNKQYFAICNTDGVVRRSQLRLAVLSEICGYLDKFYLIVKIASRVTHSQINAKICLADAICPRVRIPGPDNGRDDRLLCSPNGSVLQIDLVGISVALRGSLPSAIGALTNVIWFDVFRAPNVSGTIPTEVELNQTFCFYMFCCVIFILDAHFYIFFFYFIIK